MVKNWSASARVVRCGFDPWVRKIPWRRAWLHIPVFLPRKSMDRGAWQATVHRVAKSQTQLKQLSMRTHSITGRWERAPGLQEPVLLAKCSHFVQGHGRWLAGGWCSGPSFKSLCGRESHLHWQKLWANPPHLMPQGSGSSFCPRL